MQGKRAIRRIFGSLALAAGLLLATNAIAGEMKFSEGSKPLAASEDGNLTAEGKKAAIKELDKIPGEDAWDLFVWIKVDRGGSGPLYVEFYQTVQGKEYIVHRHEERNYDGEKYLATNMLLEGNQGFNKDRTYRVQAIQNDGKKDIKLAEAKIKLINTGREPEEGDAAESDEDEISEQDKLDSFAGPDDEGAEEGEEPDAPAPEPPETEAPSKKKGCSIDGDPEVPFGALVLIGAGLVAVRRRR